VPLQSGEVWYIPAFYVSICPQINPICLLRSPHLRTIWIYVPIEESLSKHLAQQAHFDDRAFIYIER
jgi:hypothetical protein